MSLRERLLDGRHALAGGCRAERRTGLLGPLAAVLDHVEPDHANPGGHEETDHELADEAQADHARGLAQLDLALAYAVHGDGPDGREGGVLRRDALRDRDAHVGRDPVVLRVQRVLVACRGDQLADAEILSASPHLGYHTA